MDRTDAEDAIEVELSDTQGHLRVDPDELIALVREVLIAEGHPRASISIALVDEAAIHAINRAHLGHDWPTDVISFPLSESSEPILAGELVVSAERAAATAAEVGVDPRDELALYVIHGLLHLCGYDDLSEPEAARMRRREGELLAALGRPNPFDLVASTRSSPGDCEAPPLSEQSAIPASPAPSRGRISVREGRPESATAPLSPPLTNQSEPSPWSR